MLRRCKGDPIWALSFDLSRGALPLRFRLDMDTLLEEFYEL